MWRAESLRGTVLAYLQTAHLCLPCTAGMNTHICGILTHIGHACADLVATKDTGGRTVGWGRERVGSEGLGP